jgi:cellulose synthase/poly-beta-1,6-N-acetylglucosamine synthase-like glycosyltransferase
MVNSLITAPEWYRRRAWVLISEFGEDLHEYFEDLKKRNEIEIKELLFYFSSVYVSEDLKLYLIENVEYLIYRVNQSENDYKSKALLLQAIEALSVFHYKELNKDIYIDNENLDVRKVAIKALAKEKCEENLMKLINMLKNKAVEKSVVAAINQMVNSERTYINFLVDLYNKEKDKAIKNGIAICLSYNVEYLLLKLLSSEKEKFKGIITEIIIQDRNSSIIAFLNRNKNIELENDILLLVKKAGEVNSDIYSDYCVYLDDRILNKIDKGKHCIVNSVIKEENKKTKVRLLSFLLIMSILIFPIIYGIRHNDIIFSTPIIYQLKIYIIDFNYYLIYYSTLINLIYFVLLILSFIGVAKQNKYWNIKKISFLFKKNMLPTISIIAPAYNEEATIVESINSLLNLTYPDYELIVVNDGSKDSTLDTLINYFKLEKEDYIVDYKIRTKPVLGIYKNQSYPKLTVVDKVNGGKADTLNAGINLSIKEYFCGIDADSLLESDALLKISSLVIDEDKENVALGGNILPINGCTVDKGYITDIKVPSGALGKFQMIEYLRAFMAGRIGWAQVNSLLIISGAFGVFKKDRVIEIGGYLTSSGKFNKDTVGEDMELVVRLAMHMRENKLKYKINYSFNANCWTEVPEKIKVLHSQRDRWHRGLIDILTFHKKSIFNPVYGRMGLISMPYFFIFEMMGPLVEIQGYIMVILAGILGLLNVQIAVLLFLSTILMGVFISITSLFIAEKNVNYISTKELLILIGYSILENFGFRQLVSMWRLSGYISSLKKPKGWGKMERKGFVSSETLTR